MSDENLDLPLWGAENIGREAGVVKAKGDQKGIRKSFYLLENGLLPATKIGRQWTSTRRRIRRALAGESA
jgi:hypothetical protein